MSEKKRVLIIFGGKSGEHEVSVRSARSIEEHIDRERFEPYVLGITQDGIWHLGENVQSITQGLQVLPPTEHISLPGESGNKELSVQKTTGLQRFHFDIVFPIIHGTNGEDGKLQGLLEMVDLPYVGAGVLGSALTMDKVIQKQLCANVGIPQTKFEWFWKHEWDKDQQSILDRIQHQLQYPMFVKPANLGSSVGITKANNQAELLESISTALQYDLKIIVEEGVAGILEVEVSVLGNHDPVASVCGSIKPKAEFYDYDTKYVTDDIEAKIPAEIPDEDAKKIQETAVQTYTVLNCSGMARVDFFYQPVQKKYFLSEMNTLPGFTSISMYPKLWEASGLSYPKLISKLLDLAVEHWEEKRHLKYTQK